MSATAIAERPTIPRFNVDLLARGLRVARETYLELRILDPQDRSGNLANALAIYQAVFRLAEKLTGASPYEATRNWRAEEAVADHIAAGRQELLDELGVLVPKEPGQSFAAWREALAVRRETWRPGTDERVIMNGGPFARPRSGSSRSRAR